MTLELMSPAFDSGEEIPTKYTCEGRDVSPPLQWRGVPSTAQTLVLVCDDPDAPSGIWSHWILYDIPADRDELPEGFATEEMADQDGTQGRNDFGDLGYGGPCPAAGSEHHYYFRLYALESELGLPPGANRKQILDRTEDHVVDRAELMGRYARSV